MYINNTASAGWNLHLRFYSRLQSSDASGYLSLLDSWGENSLNLEIEGGGLCLPLDPDNGSMKGKCEIRTCGLLEGSRRGEGAFLLRGKKQTEDF